MQVHTPLDPVTKHRKGVAYVTFAQPSNALAAYEALDKKSFQGRLIHILGAVDKQGKVEAEGRKKGLKDEKAAKRKAAAGKEFNWSMLYMNVRISSSKLILGNFLRWKIERCSCIIHSSTHGHQQVRYS